MADPEETAEMENSEESDKLPESKAIDGEVAEEDDDQWLYADEQNHKEGNEENRAPSDTEAGDRPDGEQPAQGDKDNDEEEADDEEKENDTDSSDEDDGMMVTIGDIKKQTDIIPAAVQARFQPKTAPTAGLKDEDFATAGKINGTPIEDLTAENFDDKPWRKPGTDISDYFNYGFNEETWFKYCHRQKHMRVDESGAGLGGLGFHVHDIRTTMNDNDANRYKQKKNIQIASVEMINTSSNNRNNNQGSKGNVIQVMTASRRDNYSSKMYNNPPPGRDYEESKYDFDDNMDFGGNPYSAAPYFSPSLPPPSINFYPPPQGPPSGPPPPIPYTNTWSAPPWPTENPPPSMGGAVLSIKVEDEHERPTERVAPSVPQVPGEEEPIRPRRNSGSRSPPRARHTRRHSRSRSRSRSPSHRHKRKRSKRDKDTD